MPLLWPGAARLLSPVDARSCRRLHEAASCCDVPAPIGALATNINLLQKGDGFECPHAQPDLVPWDTLGSLLPDKTIYIPSGRKVLLSGCMLDTNAIYNKVVVSHGAELVIDDAPMHWRVGQIVVRGKLRIGSAACRTINPSAQPMASSLPSQNPGLPSSVRTV